MRKDINLTSSEWTDIVFEGRNKEYGAYVLRQTSTRRHVYALLISTSIVAAIIIFPAGAGFEPVSFWQRKMFAAQHTVGTTARAVAITGLRKFRRAPLKNAFAEFP